MRDVSHLAARHTGRIWFEDGWWRYACKDCDYGAGSQMQYAATVVHPWLIRTADEHTNPAHWSRKRCP